MKIVPRQSGKQANLISGQNILDLLRDESEVTSEKLRYKKGTVVRIKDNNTEHGFQLDEFVKIIDIVESLNAYDAQRINERDIRDNVSYLIVDSDVY